MEVFESVLLGIVAGEATLRVAEEDVSAFVSLGRGELHGVGDVDLAVAGALDAELQRDGARVAGVEYVGDAGIECDTHFSDGFSAFERGQDFGKGEFANSG